MGWRGGGGGGEEVESGGGGGVVEGWQYRTVPKQP